MFKYNVKIQKVSGSLNESAMPSKNLVVKSKTKKTDKEVFAEASKFFKNKYGLVIESAEITNSSSFNRACELYNKNWRLAEEVIYRINDDYRTDFDRDEQDELLDWVIRFGKQEAFAEYVMEAAAEMGYIKI